MLIGPGVNQLERRITAALCSGTLRLRESDLLQNISRRIGFYQERTFLSPSQAGWLYTILTNFEQRAKGHSSKRPTLVGSATTPPHSSPEPASEPPAVMRALAGLDNVSWPEEDAP
jgi:hypothetical protein